MNTKSNLVDSIHSQMSALAKSKKFEIDGWLKEKAKTVETTGLLVGELSKKETIIQEHLSAFKSDEHIYDIYLGFTKDGSVLDGGDWVAPSDYDARTRPWYITAEEAGAITYSLTYADEANGWKNVLSASIPVFDSYNRLFGVIAGDMDLSAVSSMINNIDIGVDGSYATLIDNKGIVLAHPEQDMLAKNLLEMDEMSGITTTMLAKKSGSEYFDYSGTQKLMVYETIPSTGWIVGLTLPTDEILKPLKAVEFLYVIILAVALLVTIACSLLISRFITKPITKLIGVTEKISQGDLTQEVEVTTKDEIGALGIAFNAMVRNLQSLVQSVNETSIDLSASSQELMASSEQSSRMSEKIAGNVSELVAEVEVENGMIDRTNNTVAEMAKGIEQIASNAQLTTEHGMSAREAIESGKSTVDVAITSMKNIEVIMDDSVNATRKLGETSGEIGNIVKMITDIAEQTNLLALNAAIEAARAGDQGRGFAVVAEEVRKLAVESSNAAAQITSLIEEVQEETKKAVDLMNNGDTVVKDGSKRVLETGEAFNKIYASINEIAQSVEEVSAATEEMYAGSEEVVATMNEITEQKEQSMNNTREISYAVEEQTGSVEEIAASAERLSEMALDLQEQIQKFKV